MFVLPIIRKLQWPSSRTSHRGSLQIIFLRTQSLRLRNICGISNYQILIRLQGHSHGGRNGTGYQTSSELNAEKNNIEGLLEILSLDFPDWDLPAGIKVPNTFSHIGMVVPNATDTQSRLEAMGANIIKAAGAPFTIEGPFSDATGFTLAGNEISQEEINLIMKTLGPLNAPLMFVADPDGNIIEVQNQDGSQLV
jgi:lactoylglutathione lyase